MADIGEEADPIGPMPFSESRHSHADGGSRNKNGGSDTTESESKSAARGSKKDVAVAVPDEDIADAVFDSNGGVENPFQGDRLPLWERDQKMPRKREEDEERHQVRTGYGGGTPNLGQRLTLEGT